jgi:hypothetical protein
MRKLVLILLLAAVAPSVADAARQAPRQVLSRSAIAGPSGSGSRVIWGERTSGYPCLHLAVRDSSTLRKHDPGYRKSCDDDYGLDIPAIAWGAGSALWVRDTGGNNREQTVYALGPHGLAPSAPDAAGYGYTAEPGWDGHAIVGASGSSSALVYSVLGYTLDQNAADAEPKVSDGNVWSLERGRWRKLPVGWPVRALAVSGRSIAVANATRALVEIHDIATWRLEHRYRISGVDGVALSNRFLVLHADSTIVAYRRGGGLFARRRVVDPAYDSGTPKPAVIAASDEGIAYGDGDSIVVLWSDGRTTTTTSTGSDGLAMAGHRIFWRDGATIGTQLLRPR